MKVLWTKMLNDENITKKNPQDLIPNKLIVTRNTGKLYNTYHSRLLYDHPSKTLANNSAL